MATKGGNDSFHRLLALTLFGARAGFAGGLGLTAGGLLLSRKESQQAIPGRVLRVRGKIVAAPVGLADGWQRPGPGPALSTLSPEGRRALAAAWTAGARAEHASVPAFSRLSLTLMAHGPF
jgi:hypothetical protein